MSIAKILAPLTGGARDAIVVRTAFAAAEPYGSHVEALFVRPDPADAMPLFGEGVSGAVLQEIVDLARQAADIAASAAAQALRKNAEEHGAEMIDRPEKRDRVTASFREVDGNFADQIGQASRLSDLVVFGPLKEKEKPGLTEAFEAVLLDTGRPVLIASEFGAPSFGSCIAVAYDGSVASARAVTAALPYLKRAKQVQLFTICGADAEEAACHEALDYLSLHGIACTEQTADPCRRAVGDVILEAAAKCKADLLVLGGYGHSRLRQSFFGGVTKHVVNQTNVPLFLVH